MESELINNDVNLPQVTIKPLPWINELTQALNIPRDVLASDEEISFAWSNLPRELRDIPVDLRGELIARMCVAVSTGLFDGAMNYVWNASIIQLRDKVRQFGLAIVASINSKDFEEKDLLELQDFELIGLCLKLSIIDEDAYFFLDQCRALRNNYSAAHPTIGKINDREFIVFLNRCVRYALIDTVSPKGIKIDDLISSIKSKRLNDTQKSVWANKLNETHSAQRQMIVKMAHGVYCDSQATEYARLNAIDVCLSIKSKLTNPIKSTLLNQHQEFLVKDGNSKYKASIQFFQRLGLLSILNESELNSLFSNAVERLWQVHNGMNNFYNEPAFAERLLEITNQNKVPDVIVDSFVQTVVCCRIGNGYGVSRAARSYYDDMIKAFSPMEVAALMRLVEDKETLLNYRINNYSSCKNGFINLLELIDDETVPAVAHSTFKKFKK